MSEKKINNIREKNISTIVFIECSVSVCTGTTIERNKNDKSTRQQIFRVVKIIGAISNWNAGDITVDLSFLGSGNFEAEIFRDGINADRDATDYKREIVKPSSNDKLPVHLSNGCGWAVRIYPAK